MRVLTTATMAASALAIGLGMNTAQSFAPGGLPGGRIASPDTVVHQTQQQEKGTQPGMGGAAQKGGGAGQGGPSMQNGGGKMRGEGGGVRPGGSQFRAEEKGLRGEHGFRGEQGLRGERGRRGEFGYREGGGRRHFGERGGVYFGPSYGYRSGGCGWLRQRALATDSSYWWRRYRACRGF